MVWKKSWVWVFLLGFTACEAGSVNQPQSAATPTTTTTNPGNETGPTAPNGVPSAPDETQPDPILFPFVPQPSSVYTNKIKTLLTGLPATPEEVTLGETDDGLATAVDTWMATSAYQNTLMSFFGIAFQQSLMIQPDVYSQAAFGTQLERPESQMLRESFPRTALYYVNNDIPFNQLATTSQFMMTPRLLLFYALIDQFGTATTEGGDYFASIEPNVTMVFSPTGGASSIDDLKNPQSPNYLHFPWPALSPTPTAQQCHCDPVACGFNGGPLTFTPATFTYSKGGSIWSFMTGTGVNFYTHPVGAASSFCTLQGPGKNYLVPSDDTDWRLVTIRTPKTNEAPARIYDLPTFRTASEVVFRVPRVGFFTTPSFLGQWATNLNNQARVTINQTMVVGLNKVFDGRDQTVPNNLQALPLEHAAKGTTCYGCHLTMDPMRQYFVHEMSYNFHPQTDPNERALGGAWGQSGITAQDGGLAQLGAQIANAPDFASAWTLKLCAWLNSGACEPSDPEIKRIADNFQANGFKFNALMKDMLTSPLTTYKTSTTTATHRGAIATISRREQFCRTMSARLNFPDICGLDKRTAPTTINTYLRLVMSTYPSDGYSRATTTLAQTTRPNSITRIGLENICGNMALQVVDNPAAPVFSSSDPNTAVTKILSQVLGLDPNIDTEVMSLFTTHYTDARAQGVSASTALRSCFMLACLSPYLSTIGQ